MKITYTDTAARMAHVEWKASCGHFSIAAATGVTLDDIRNAGVPLKGWMNPTMVGDTLHSLKIPHDLLLIANQPPESFLTSERLQTGAILRVQFEGPWMAPHLPPGARYSRTHYIATDSHTVMDPMITPDISITRSNWLYWMDREGVGQIKNATAYHFTHAWILNPPNPAASSPDPGE